MSGPEQAATVTPGQAAYEVVYADYAVDEDWSPTPWAKLTDAERADWEAAAQAAVIVARKPRTDSLTERVAGLVTEGNELRKLLGEIKAVVLWDGTHQTKIRRVLELLGVFDPQPEAVVTAGTGHLAGKIRELAIPDED